MEGKKGGRKRPRDQTAASAAAVAASSASQDNREQPRRKKRRRTLGPPAPDVLPKFQVYCPDLILRRVFGHLDKQDKASVARACSRWRNLVYAPSLWRNETACLHLDSLSPADIDSLKRRKIRDVTVLSCSKIEAMRELIHKVETIEKFTVVCCTLTERQLKYVFSKNLSKIRTLQLKVRSVNSDICANLTDRMANLETLQVIGGWNEDTLSILGCVRQLKTLFLVDSLLIPMTGPTISPQPAGMHCLTYLVLRGAEIGDAALCYLKQTVPNLQNLHVELRGDITATGLGHLADLSELDTLSIATKHPLPSVAPFLKLKKLQYLNLLVAFISSAGVKFLGKLPALKHLGLFAHHMNEDGWKHFGQGFHSLQTLSLCGCGLSRTEVKYLAKLPCLKELKIYRALAVDFHRVCRTLHRLEALTVSNSITFNDEDLRSIAQMPRLKSLVLRAVSPITSDGLRHLSEGRAPLEILHLQSRNLTSRGLLHLANGPRTLRELGISGEQDCMETLLELVQRNQSIRIVRANMTAFMKQKVKQLRPGLIIHPSLV